MEARTPSSMPPPLWTSTPSSRSQPTTPGSVVEWFAAEQIHDEGMAPVLETIPRDRAVYLTIDADGLDPTEMPAVMAPTPGGIYFRQLAPLLRTVARQNRIVGMDIVEIAPSYDFTNGLTAIMAGRLILNVLTASWGEGGAMRRAG